VSDRPQKLPAGAGNSPKKGIIAGDECSKIDTRERGLLRDFSPMSHCSMKFVFI
jgi:hypothetical protein